MNAIETVALDLEKVLADPDPVAWPLSDVLDESWLGTWFGNHGSEDVFEEYMRITDEAWQEHYEEIPPVEPDLDLFTDHLNTIVDVDVVTNRGGADEQIIEWLDIHGVDYNEFYAMHHGYSKADLEYDAYIDDNPNMIGDVRLQYLRDAEVNKEHREIFQEKIDQDRVVYYDWRADSRVMPSANDNRVQVCRVYSIQDVIDDLSIREAEGSVAI